LRLFFGEFVIGICGKGPERLTGFKGLEEGDPYDPEKESHESMLLYL
jgi:hypothetical protein